MTGHERLIKDLEELLQEAKQYEFHDFKNTHYATPKVMLRAKLHGLASNVMIGTYDNEPRDKD